MVIFSYRQTQKNINRITCQIHFLNLSLGEADILKGDFSKHRIGTEKRFKKS